MSGGPDTTVLVIHLGGRAVIEELRVIEGEELQIHVGPLAGVGNTAFIGSVSISIGGEVTTTLPLSS